MATDVQSALGVKITSTGVVKTTNELTAFAKAAKAAGAAGKPINLKVSSAGLSKALSDIQKLDKAMRALGGKGNASSARLKVAGGAAAIREINNFTKAVSDARKQVGSGITVNLKTNGSQAAVKGINDFEKAVSSARKSVGKGLDLDVKSSGSINSTSTSVIGLKNAVLGLVSAMGALAAGRFFAKVTDEANLMAARLRLATAETGNFAKAQEDVRRIAASSRSDLDTTATLYQRIMINAKALGLAQSEVAKATETITKSFKVSGTSTIEATNATRQLIQALQSGVLRGDEFRSVMEQGPRLAQIIAEGMGTTVDKLRELAEEGKLTAQAVLDATLKSYDKINDEFSRLPVTFGDAMGQIYNAAVITFGAFDEGGEFSKMLTGFLIGGVKGINDLEASARRFGVAFRGEIDGIVNAFGPVIKSMSELEWLFGKAETSSRGMFSTLFKELDAITGWWDRNKWWLSALMGPGAINIPAQHVPTKTGLSDPYEKGRSEAYMRGVLNADPVHQFLSQGGILKEKEAAAAIAKTAEEKKKAKTASERLAERLERERQANEALIAGNYAVFDAYKKSNVEAIKAGAIADATAKGIKRQADLEAYVAQNLRKVASERIRASGEMVYNLDREGKAQEFVNKQLASGAIAYEDAADALAKIAKFQELNDTLNLAKELGDPKAIKAATEAVIGFEKAWENATAAQKEFIDGQKAWQLDKTNDVLEKQVSLERKLSKERTAALKGLSGDSLENELARINDERERGNLLIEFETKINEARRLGQWKYVEALERERDLRLEMLGISQGSAKQEREWEQNKRRAINASREMADIIGGSIGSAANAIMDAVDKFEQVFGKDIWGGLGDKFAGVFKVLEKMGAGAKVGTAVDGVFDAIGIKSSKTGAQIGGAIGQFGGPLGAIAGSIAGGIIGGMLKSTPRASATVSIIAGEAMETAIKGSSGKLRKIAGGLADSVITGLSDIADQLGADLIGDANVSIGMRKKNYRVDPTGRGITKTSKGAIDFGDDQASAIAYAIQVAIQQGVIGGLSASLERLITADGDLQRNLQKAMSFQSVFDELLQRLDPQGFDLAQLDKWRAGMDKLFAEAGATAEELAKLEELTELKRAEIVEKYANKVEEIEDHSRRRRELEIQIMELEGDAAGALAAQRELELSGMHESLHALQQRVYALQDEASAAAEAARAAEEAAQAEEAAKQLANERRRLEIQIMELEGNAVEALAATRAMEIEAADESLHALMRRIYALQDEAEAANAAAKAAEELAAKNKAIADEIGGLERQWLELIGDVGKLRELQLGDLLSDDARAMQQMIWAEQDRQAAAAEAARAAEQAAQAYARAVQEHNQAIENARNQLAQAYEREVGALRQTIDKFREFGKAIREFREGLFISGDPRLEYEVARSRFQNTARMAALGNEASLGAITGDASTFLDAARSQAKTLEEFRLAEAMVNRGLLGAEKGVAGMITGAQQQIRIMDRQLDGILDLNEKAMSFDEALRAYTELQAKQVPQMTHVMVEGLSEVSENIEALKDESGKTSAEQQRALEALVVAANMLVRVTTRNEGPDGFRTSIEGPVAIQGTVPVLGAVSITNGPANPVPVEVVP